MLTLPCHTQALRKLFDNRPQHTLTREERMGNVLGAYEADPDVVHHQRILLVDDIQTTGATLNECAKVLKLRGASRGGGRDGRHRPAARGYTARSIRMHCPITCPKAGINDCARIAMKERQFGWSAFSSCIFAPSSI